MKLYKLFFAIASFVMGVLLGDLGGVFIIFSILGGMLGGILIVDSFVE